MSEHAHKDCRHLLDSLSDFIDGSLASEICQEIQHHLDECPDCHVVVDTLRKTIYLYKTTSELPSVPADVRERLYHSLDIDEYLEN
jgi:anti-sigma factor (TIGR02949 family)